jgi:hypothetical protein
MRLFRVTSLSNKAYFIFYRSFGNPDCTECKESCAGHYLKPHVLFPKVIANTKVDTCLPPTDILKDLFLSGPNRRQIVEGASTKVLLPQDKVNMRI